MGQRNNISTVIILREIAFAISALIAAIGILWGGATYFMGPIPEQFWRMPIEIKLMAAFLCMMLFAIIWSEFRGMLKSLFKSPGY